MGTTHLAVFTAKGPCMSEVLRKAANVSDLAPQVQDPLHHPPGHVEIMRDLRDRAAKLVPLVNDTLS